MWKLLTVPLRGMSHYPGPSPLKVEEGYPFSDLWTGLLCKWGRQEREKVTGISCTWGAMWPQQWWRTFIPGESMKWGSCPVTKPGRHCLTPLLSTLQQLVGSHECQCVSVTAILNNNNKNKWQQQQQQEQMTTTTTTTTTTLYLIICDCFDQEIKQSTD